MKDFIKYWIPVIVWLAVVFALSAIPSLQVESLGMADFVFRKLAHLGEFLILAVLLFRAIKFHSREKVWKIFLLVLFLGFLYAALDEFHQLYVPGREGSLIDVLIDSSGVLLGALSYLYSLTKM